MSSLLVSIISRVFRYRTTVKFTMRITDNWAVRKSMTVHFSPALNSDWFPDKDALRKMARRQALYGVSRLTRAPIKNLKIALENLDGFVIEHRGK